MKTWAFIYKNYADAYIKYSDILSGRKEGENPRIMITDDNMYEVQYEK